MITKTIHGKKYDADEKTVLSRNDNVYRSLFEDVPPYKIREFIDYLMSGTVLDWKWNSSIGYNELKYSTADGTAKILRGTHGITQILRGIEKETWNPSDVLHDFSVFYRGCKCDDASEDEREKLYQEVKELIKRGFNVEVVDNSKPEEMN